MGLFVEHKNHRNQMKKTCLTLDFIPRNSISVLVHHAAHADRYALLRSVLISNGQILTKLRFGPENEEVFFGSDLRLDN